ncbi:DUF3560 domain-containing protein (plasmid) [Agrobacterium sp. rho-13.3]|uniref:DUF3560 domain-containing protein n=1 Tax=Agrobacterium sp. rho-13.3 TaxID=3072980 RepID=UPI002A15B257|nr:DUF3560 domain-containing protein [Agrobacterium sp. rho-13.3]MDX8311537.1 DUF3560 domain-containing protein [Agrobacterium sp. rho-13.3]
MNDQQTKQDPALETSSDALEETAAQTGAGSTYITATYSPEDNKLRLYSLRRLDAETYARVREAGYHWAPKQELFVAPSWSPGREDLAIELAGEIEPEQMTLAERAQAKADRLEALAERRNRESGAYYRAANDLSRAFEGGQPILVGHHSERKARKTQARMHSAMAKSVEAGKSANYWLYKVEGVEAHANMKNSPRVRANRIRTLLAELRDLQRTINHGHLRLKFWENTTDDDKIRSAVGSSIPTGSLSSHDLYDQVRKGTVTPQEAREMCIRSAKNTIDGKSILRWIEHTLNRLSYEREMLGTVERYEGPLSETMLQIFARENGAHKPAAKKTGADAFTLTSSVPLPLHLADASSIELSADDWRDLMQSVGYEVPAKKEGPPPILNLQAKKLQSRSLYHRGQIDSYPVVEMTKAAYSGIYADYRGVRVSVCGGFRFKICKDPSDTGSRLYAAWVAVFLTDSKAHPLPDSIAEQEKAEGAA